MFVSWCADQAGISRSIIKPHAYCPYFVSWWQNTAHSWYYSPRHGGSSSFQPQAGDIIFFSDPSSTNASHVGLVRDADQNYVYTIEGNTSGQHGEVNDGGGCFKKSYSLSYNRILGYGRSKYEEAGEKIIFDSCGGSPVPSARVKPGEPVPQPENPTKYGMDFLGWFTEPDGNNKWDFSQPWPEWDGTLYAHWKQTWWGGNTDLMPVEQPTETLKFASLPERENPEDPSSPQKVWPYYHDDSGQVDIYNGVDGAASWPTLSTQYENCFDAGHGKYLYIRKGGTAQFNAVFTYLDNSGNPHTVKLSELAGRGDTDFPAGEMEIRVNLGDYILEQGLNNETSNVNYTKMTYFVVGTKDQLVVLYEAKLINDDGGLPALADSLISPSEGEKIQQKGDVGNGYAYENGVLTMKDVTDSPYSVTIPVELTYNPLAQPFLLMDIDSQTDFNITFDLSSGVGEHETMDILPNFFPQFGINLDEDGDGTNEKPLPSALPKGPYSLILNLEGYYKWNGGDVSTSTIHSVTVTAVGEGTLTLKALQLSAVKEDPQIIDDQQAPQKSEVTEGWNTASKALTSSAYTVDKQTVSRIPLGATRRDLFNKLDQNPEFLRVMDGKNPVTDSDTVLKTGMTVEIVDGDRVIATYTIAVTGDVDGDGSMNTVDARMALQGVVDEAKLKATERLAADLDGDGAINSTDVQQMLRAVVFG